MQKAYVSDIQHFNVHDGPGIRTDVFYQGCALNCKWCQNPETIFTNPVVMYNPEECAKCGACIAECPNKAIQFEQGNLVTDSQKCTACGACEKVCYFNARKLSSHTMTVEEVFQEVMKDEVVYRKSGGGITISGGEPLLQIDFNIELLKRIKQAGISTAVETAGFFPTQNLERIAPYVDTFLFDFKLNDEMKHKQWIGKSNKRIKENLIRACEIHDNVVVRIPLIPTVNDSNEEFSNMMQFVSKLHKINSVHILPFHNFGAGKYQLIGKTYEVEHLNEENSQRVQACAKIAKNFGFRVNVGGTGFKEDKQTTETIA